MIYTKRSHLHRYLGLSESMDAAIHYLLSADLSALTMGRNDIAGDQTFVNRFNYQTVPAHEAAWEGHTSYGDIHVVLSGRERIGVSCADSLTVTQRNPQEDFVGYRGEVQTWVDMTPEDILIVFPEDAHMVKVAMDESVPVEKACFKFKVS